MSRAVHSSTSALSAPHRRRRAEDGAEGAGRGDLPRRRRSPPRPDRARELRWSLIFLAPMTLGLVVFNFWPLLRTFYFSFTDWGPFGGQEFTGLDNYRELIADGEVWHSLLVSVGYTAMLLAAIPVAATVATMLNQRNLRWLSGYRVLYFLPVVTMPVAAALLWRLLFNGEYGLVNYLLSVVGIDGPNWLTRPGYALFAVGIVGIWIMLGQQIVILLAGLQGIPREIYEASDVDGAGVIQKFRHITLPLLTPSLFFVAVLTTIWSLQMFDILYVMLDKGNPALAETKTIVYLFYEVGFIDNDRGYAAAIAFLLLAVILLFTVVQFRLQKRWVHYD